MEAKSKEEWWRLVRQDLAKWNQKSHTEDQMSLQDWIGEVGPIIHGGQAFIGRSGDWDVALAGNEDDN